MTNTEKVATFLEESGVFYLTTIDGDKPKCRPIGLQMVVDDKLYFGVGTFKDVYKQIEKNPNVEICACKEGGWLRYYGKAEISSDESLSEKAINMMPDLRGIYNDETGYKLGVFSLKDAIAEFRSMLSVEEKIKF